MGRDRRIESWVYSREEVNRWRLEMMKKSGGNERKHPPNLREPDRAGLARIIAAIRIF